MTRSVEEQAIRIDVVARLRELLPDPRIVHELNVAGQGTNRIDVAAITTDVIVGVEIKSQKDTLKRLDAQWAAFSKCCHLVIVAAHEKHFTPYRSPGWRDDAPPDIDLNHPLFFGKFRTRERAWRFPRPEGLVNEHGQRRDNGERWFFDLWRDILPKVPLHSGSLLEMLWASELQAECRRHRLSVSSRSTRYMMIREMALLMNGKEIAQAVCRQLRARTFAEADPPIPISAPAGAGGANSTLQSNSGAAP